MGAEEADAAYDLAAQNDFQGNRRRDQDGDPFAADVSRRLDVDDAQVNFGFRFQTLLDFRVRPVRAANLILRAVLRPDLDGYHACVHPEFAG